MKALLAVLEDEEQINTHTAKLTRQQAGVDNLLKKLQEAVKDNDLEDDTETPVRINNNKRVFSYMQMRVQSTEKIVNTKLQIV